MGSIVLKLKILIAHIIYFPLILKYKKSKNKYLIDQDIERWSNEVYIPIEGAKVLAYLLWIHPQFRNIFFFRIQCHSGLLRLICKPDPTISIADDCEQIEGGLYFEHAFATIIAVKHIGKNCIIRQLTTFGVKSKDRHEERPYIGDNVDFGANVTCIGSIKIGDNAVVAAGSVVVKDVPDNAVVAGNPARVFKYIDKKPQMYSRPL